MWGERGGGGRDLGGGLGRVEGGNGGGCPGERKSEKREESAPTVSNTMAVRLTEVP